MKQTMRATKEIIRILRDANGGKSIATVCHRLAKRQCCKFPFMKWKPVCPCDKTNTNKDGRLGTILGTLLKSSNSSVASCS